MTARKPYDSVRHTTMRALGVFIMSALIIAMGAVAEVRGGSVTLQENEIKAAYLYNFAKFVEWPAGTFRDASSPFTICTLGKDTLGAALDSLKNKTVEGRPLLVKRVAKVEESEKCQILFIGFIGASERDNTAQILGDVGNRSILTVGDSKGFAQAGGVVNLVPEGDRVIFEINVDAAERRSLKISSKLLKLGKIVRDGR